jgi:integrase
MANQKPYTLFKRGKVWYVQFRTIDGERVTPKSTGETAKARAESWAINYLQVGNGQIVQKENITFENFSKGFFDYSAPWATDKRVRGLRIAPYHCLQREDLLKNHINPVIGKMKLTAIDRAVIKDFRNKMFKDGYSGNTINKCLSAIKTILDDAEEKSLIQYVPRIDRAAENPKTKGVLTPEEVKQLFSFEWMTKPVSKHPSRPDYMGQVSNLLAVTTGLRLSEIQGLTLQDINLENNYITVRRSWNNRLYCLNEETKTGKERVIFFSNLIKEHIKRLIAENPHGHKPDNFLFYSEIRERAKDQRAFSVSLFNALERIGIDEDERKARNITFHSHRHFLNSLLINAKVPLQKVQNIVGHGSVEMSNHYYRIDDMADVLMITDSLLSEKKFN